MRQSKQDLLLEKIAVAVELCGHAERDAGSSFSDFSTVLGTLGRLAETVESAQRTCVELLRSQGASWEVVGNALNVSRQAAWERWGK